MELKWLESHIGTIEDGKTLIRSVGWNLSVEYVNDKWFVKDGEKPILITKSEDTVEVFLYGMALAYSIVPDSIMKLMQDEFEV